MEAKAKQVCDMRDKLIRKVESAMDSNKGVNAQELGEVIDMIKDLSECEKDLWEAKYYKDKVQGGESATIMQ